jgi:hypothetical protein
MLGFLRSGSVRQRGVLYEKRKETKDLAGLRWEHERNRIQVVSWVRIEEYKRM